MSLDASSPWSRGKASLLFTAKFVRHGTRVASVTPSSRSLARSMCRGIDRGRVQTIVELGAGTGPVTAAAVAAMHPDSRLIAVEVDPQLAAIVRARCPQATVVEADVRNLDAELQQLGVDSIDVVLSGLPVPSLPKVVNAGVFTAFERAGRNALFSQLTLMPWVYGPMYRRLFEDVRFEFVLCNVPPGGVYHARKLRSDYAAAVPGKV